MALFIDKDLFRVMFRELNEKNMLLFPVFSHDCISKNKFKKKTILAVISYDLIPLG